MMGKQMLGDYYLKQLVEVNKATITRYETHIIDGNVMFYLAGHMKNPNTADTSAAAPVSFAATIILGNEGNVAVARMIGPAGTSLSTPRAYRCARWIQVDYYIEYEPIFASVVIYT